MAEISGTTLWRWLNADALRPWQYRSWIFPRDPDFAAKAGCILDHASWLNQIEIYFSSVQRKVLTPNDFLSLAQLEQRLLDFQKHYQQTASPFQWTFTRKDLNTLLTKISTKAFPAAA